MRNLSTLVGKICAVIALGSLLAGSAFSQIKLRNAMDYDHDGKADLVVWRPDGNNWFILKSAGGFIVQNWGDSTDDTAAPGDYDGDGTGDIAVWRSSNGQWYIINSLDGTITVTQWGTNGDEPVARDYDGDGKTDLAVARRNGGPTGPMVWYILKSTGGFDVTEFGISADFVTPGDYDGDGKFDIAVQRVGPNQTDQATYYVLNSSGGFTIFDWGITTDFAVPGDYDGDGKTDFAVIREEPAENNQIVWYIFYSKTLTFARIPWGAIADDLEVQNDYDGDGITDIAVWRNSDGNFYILNSGGGFTVTQWGTANDFPVASYDTH